MTYSEAIRELEELDFSEHELDQLIIQQGEHPIAILEQYKSDNGIA